MIDHPKYCKYHQIVSHPIEKCFVLKDLIIHMENEGKIQLNGGEETTIKKMTMVSLRSFNPILVSNLLSLMIYYKKHFLFNLKWI
ncbi:hypothetical protein NC653_011824 [Populus alba x Populus x berolinensis]|uniref:Retrotransposon gag protein n=1 Tax=Populus alba x Populus x berolinensis TaxID=444605 RepID=A0AAD6R384_9ROSI|nr:hypothetical protein NC653_011824 [Populus alba x Populus x berolinensis]